jgi:AcrR family transcriptional regulator
MKSRQPGDGRSARWEPHRQSRREELLACVIEAVRAHGAAVGMDQIAETARTSKAVFYRYFADKQDLYRSVGRKLAADVVEDISRAVDAASDDATMLHAGIAAYLRLIEDEPELYRFAVHNPSVDDATLANYTSLVSDLLAGIFARRLRARHYAVDGALPWGVAVVGGVRATADWWLAQPAETRPSREQLARYLVALMYRGMRGITAYRPAEDVRELVGR